MLLCAVFASHHAVLGLGWRVWAGCQRKLRQVQQRLAGGGFAPPLLSVRARCCAGAAPAVHQGDQPHCGFPEAAYHQMAETLARAGKKVRGVGV